MAFCDMDGTFLATDKTIPPDHLRALDLMAERSIVFVPCTGRPVSAVPDALVRHPATRYLVGSNGAVVFDVAQRAAVRVAAMDKRRVLELYERVGGLRTTFDIFADGHVYAERERFRAMGTYGIDAPTLAVLRAVREPVDALVPSIVDAATKVEKVTCFWADESDGQALAQAIEDVGGFSSAHGHPKNFELQAEGVSKGSALEWLARHCDVEVRDVVAFGDEANDVPMLRAAGDGVAMANATPEVLAAADHVTTSNDEAGVARYLFGI